MPLKIIECPRDAMQGLAVFIETEKKIRYINSLLKVGFDTIDFGSFVSPKAVPQMRDTAEVLDNLDLKDSNSKLLAITGNMRGANDACQFHQINYLGFPYSVSETFLKLNIKKTSEEAFKEIENINNLSSKNGKELIVYFSMVFGNPYGDENNLELTFEKIIALQNIGIKTIALADTLAMGSAENIGNVFSNIIPEFPQIEFGLHLHTEPYSYLEKIDAAYKNGCRRFDSVILGLGGCPMSKKDLVGNLNTEHLLNYFSSNDIETTLNMLNYKASLKIANEIFPIV